MNRITILLISLLILCNVTGQETLSTGIYIPKEVQHEENTLLYNILYPNDFNESKSFPLVVFLHGSGERGEKNKSQLVYGSKLFLDLINRYLAVIIFPQCPKDDFWAKINGDNPGQIKFELEGSPNPGRYVDETN